MPGHRTFGGDPPLKTNKKRSTAVHVDVFWFLPMRDTILWICPCAPTVLCCCPRRHRCEHQQNSKQTMDSKRPRRSPHCRPECDLSNTTETARIAGSMQENKAMKKPGEESSADFHPRDSRFPRFFTARRGLGAARLLAHPTSVCLPLGTSVIALPRCNHSPNPPPRGSEIGTGVFVLKHSPESCSCFDFIYGLRVSR